MKVYVDSREKPQAIKQITAYFDRHGIAWEQKKLDTGDYMLEGQPSLIIDRKQSLSELANNLLSPDRARFYREIRRALISAEMAGMNILGFVLYGEKLKQGKYYGKKYYKKYYSRYEKQAKK